MYNLPKSQHETAYIVNLFMGRVEIIDDPVQEKHKTKALEDNHRTSGVPE